jgi:hypothetical protein
MCVIFVGMGTIVLVAGLSTIETDGLLPNLLPIGMGVLFISIGITLLVGDLKARRRRKAVISNGIKHLGKIIDYADDTSVIVNGIPQVLIVVEYAPKGEVIHETFQTNSTKTHPWPIGSYVNIYEHNGMFEWDRKIL